MKCEEIFSVLPGRIRKILSEMDIDGTGLQELRIRSGRPVLAVLREGEKVSGQQISVSEVQEILSYLGSYSLYAYEDEIRQGFLSLPGGHRVGLSGRAVLENRRIRTLTEISSLNIRFAREVRGCADRLLSCMWDQDRLLPTLIVSAPGQGKTTLLRDCIRQISDGCGKHRGKTVGVVDERSELAGSWRGLPGNDLGLRTDVLDGCPKAEGMMLLIRSMAPEVIAVDEIGGREDLEAMRYAMHCGCVLLATVHGADFQELQRKPVLGEMMEQGMFERYAFLDSDSGPGHLRVIRDQRGQALPEGSG